MDPQLPKFTVTWYLVKHDSLMLWIKDKAKCNLPPTTLHRGRVSIVISITLQIKLKFCSLLLFLFPFPLFPFFFHWLLPNWDLCFGRCRGTEASSFVWFQVVSNSGPKNDAGLESKFYFYCFRMRSWQTKRLHHDMWEVRFSCEVWPNYGNVVSTFLHLFFFSSQNSTLV